MRDPHELTRAHRCPDRRDAHVEELLDAVLVLPTLTSSDLLLTVLEMRLGRGALLGVGTLLSDGRSDLFRPKRRLKGRRKAEVNGGKKRRGTSRLSEQ
jgi:hypothetical protein